MSISIPDQQLSTYFTLADLTISASFPDIDNTPNAAQLANLTSLARLLDVVYDTLGPFTVTSGFRSPALNAALSGAYAPSSTSLHMNGQAADLVPVNTDPYSYFLMIAQTPAILGAMGEIINEVDAEGIVHVSTPYPGGTGVLKYLSNGNYYRYTPDEVAAIQASSPAGEPVQVSEDDSQLDTSGVTEDDSSPSLLSMGVLIISAFFVMTVLLNSRNREPQQIGVPA